MPKSVKQVVVNRLRAAYDVEGEGPDVLLIHGWMASRRYWHEAGKRLPGFRTWALDLYGFGDSEKPAAGFGLDSYRLAVEALIERYKSAKNKI